MNLPIRRSACFDKMTFRENGTIDPVVYTLDDVVETLPPPKRKQSRKSALNKEEVKK